MYYLCLHINIYVNNYSPSACTCTNTSLVVCSINQMTFLHLGRWTPKDETSGQLTFGQTYGQVDIWSDGPPRWGFGSGWHLVRIRVRLHLVRWTPWWGLGSGWHLVRLRVRLPFGQMDSPGWGLGSGWHLVRRTIRLTFGKMDPPRSDLGSGWYFVRWFVGWPIAAGWLVWILSWRIHDI